MLPSAHAGDQPRRSTATDRVVEPSQEERQQVGFRTVHSRQVSLRPKTRVLATCGELLLTQLLSHMQPPGKLNTGANQPAAGDARTPNTPPWAKTSLTRGRHPRSAVSASTRYEAGVRVKCLS